MFGYININEPELKIRELGTYRGFYCGLCRNLHQRYGRISQMMLNYDMTFLAILLTGLYETGTEESMHRCIPHPAVRHLHLQNDAVSYAADMCVMLSWKKLVDDWKDERSYPGFAMAAMLKKDYARLRRQYPRQARAIEKNIRLLSEAERSKKTDPDEVSGLTGAFLAEIFCWKEDAWQQDLREMGYFLGKFIYLMDALEDVEKDRKKGNYNLFLNYPDVWAEPARSEIRDILVSMMSDASRAFERLPVLEHAEILRNILYAGVWCKYAAMKPENRKKREKRQA